MQRPSRLVLACAVLALAPLPGCVLVEVPADDEPSEPVDPSDPPEVPADEPSVDSDACFAGLGDAQRRDELALAYAFEDGLLTLRLGAAAGGDLVETLLFGHDLFVLAPDEPLLPEAWTHDAGAYVHSLTDDGRARVEVRFSKGAALTDDLFTLSSYLVDPVVTREDDPLGTTTITHAGPGPLVELLGLGTDPPNPIVLTALERLPMDEPLRALGVSMSLHYAFEDAQGSSAEHEAMTPRVTAGALVDGEPVELLEVSAAGWRDSTGQQLEVGHWSLTFQYGLGVWEWFDAQQWHVIEGEVRAVVHGEETDYRVIYDWERTEEPVTSIRCQ